MKNLKWALALCFIASTAIPTNAQTEQKSTETSKTAESYTLQNPVQVAGDVTPPVLVKQVNPKYPRSLFTKPKEGDVLLQCVIDTEGIPQLVHVIRSFDKKFDAAAVKAIQQYRFKPSTLHDKPVPVQLNITVVFRL